MASSPSPQNSTCWQSNTCDILPGGKYRNVYISLRVLGIGIPVLLCCLVLWRVASIVHRKLANRKTRNISSVCSDAQLHVQVCMFISLSCEWIEWIDILNVEGLLPLSVVAVLANVRDVFGLLAITRTLHVFIFIHSRFHPASLKVARGIRISVLVFVVLVIGTTAWDVSGSSLGYTATIIVSDTYAIAIVVFATAYSNRILRPSSDPAILRATSQAEQESRRRLLRLFWGLSLASWTIIALAIADGFYSATEFSLAAIFIWFAFGMVLGAGSLGLSAFYGNANAVAPNNQRPAAGPEIVVSPRSPNPARAPGKLFARQTLEQPSPSPRPSPAPTDTPTES